MTDDGEKQAQLSVLRWPWTCSTTGVYTAFLPALLAVVASIACTPAEPSTAGDPIEPVCTITCTGVRELRTCTSSKEADYTAEELSRALTSMGVLTPSGEEYPLDEPPPSIDEQEGAIQPGARFSVRGILGVGRTPRNPTAIPWEERYPRPLCRADLMDAWISMAGSDPDDHAEVYALSLGAPGPLRSSKGTVPHLFCSAGDFSRSELAKDPAEEFAAGPEPPGPGQDYEKGGCCAIRHTGVEAIATGTWTGRALDIEIEDLCRVPQAGER